MNYVLRLKGKTKGHIFYSYLEDLPLGGWAVISEKFKYAETFPDMGTAEKFIEEFIDCGSYETVTEEQAEKEYYNCIKE